jgi:hypothetical protein
MVTEARKFSGLAVDTLVELTKDSYSGSTRYNAATAHGHGSSSGEFGRPSSRGTVSFYSSAGCDEGLRVKGILNLIGETGAGGYSWRPHVFPVQIDVWPDAGQRSRIVFMARGIDRADLEASFLEHVITSRKFDASVRA